MPETNDEANNERSSLASLPRPSPDRLPDPTPCTVDARRAIVTPCANVRTGVEPVAAVRCSRENPDGTRPQRLSPVP